MVSFEVVAAFFLRHNHRFLREVYPWLYSGRKSFRMGEIRGCSCARNVIAHIMYIAAAERTRVERQTLLVDR